MYSRERQACGGSYAGLGQKGCLCVVIHSRKDPGRGRARACPLGRNQLPSIHPNSPKTLTWEVSRRVRILYFIDVRFKLIDFQL